MKKLRFGLKLLAVSTAVLAFAGATYPQSAKDADQAVKTLDAKIFQVQLAMQNILAMERMTHDTFEVRVTEAAFDSLNDASDLSDGVREVLNIYSGVESRWDREFVRNILRRVVGSSVKKVDGQIIQIDLSLLAIKSSEIRAEVTRARDLILEMRDIIKPFGDK